MGSGRTAFVFAGGGSLGAIQVGMLQALTEAGVKPDFVVGSSVGAINAAYYAQYPDQEGVDRLAEIWLGVRRSQVMPVSLWRAFLGLFLRNHLMTNGGLRRLFSKHLGGTDLRDSPMERHLLATNLADGGKVLISEGDTVQALLASTAIPAFFPPVKMNGTYLIDGGVASITPIEAAIRQGAERLIVLPTGLSCARDRDVIPSNTFEMSLYAINLLIAGQLVSDFHTYRDQARISIVPPPCPLDISLFSFDGTGELIERGREDARMWLEEDGLQTTEIPDAIQPRHYF